MDIRTLLNKAGLDRGLVDAPKGESVFLRYFATGQLKINVEITAPNLAEGILKLTVDEQTKFFVAVKDELPEVGDSLIIEDANNGKRRGARVVRLRSYVIATVDLLVTR